MKKRAVDLLCPFLILLFLQSIAFAQILQPYGLQGKTVTCLAYYGGSLFAGTEGEGVFVRQATDSAWQDLGLPGVYIHAIYPHDIGPLGWGITVGAEPDYFGGDSVLTYCWSTYQPTWVAADSGLDRERVARILAIDGFPDPRI